MKLNKKKGEVGKLQFAKKFFAAATKNEIYPNRVVRLYRVNLAPLETTSQFTYQSVRVKNLRNWQKFYLVWTSVQEN
jgi:hypothetical protein